MNPIWDRMERDMAEQLAGITPPVDPRKNDAEIRSRLHDATPINYLPANHEGCEL